MKLFKAIAATAVVISASVIYSEPIHAEVQGCEGGGNWCAYHPERSGDSTGLCQHIMMEIAKGKAAFNPNRKCHVGFDVMSYAQYIHR